MSSITGVIVGLPDNLPQGLMEVDVDPEAERLVIIDLNTIEVFFNAKVSGIFRAILPMKYATSNDLLVMMIDNDRAHASEFVEGVQLQTIDGIVTDITA